MDRSKQLASATARTVTPAAWVLALQVILRRNFWEDIDVQWDIVLQAVTVGAIGFYYRLARVVEIKYPLLSWLLLGSGKAPAAYAPVEVVEEVQDKVGPAAEQVANASAAGGQSHITVHSSTPPTL